MARSRIIFLSSFIIMRRCKTGTRKCHTGQCVAYSATTNSKKCKSGMQKCADDKCYPKIATRISFLFLTYGDIMHKKAMKQYTKNHDVFIHPKEELTDVYFKSRVIPDKVATRWGDISIVHASLALLKYAFENTSNNWFVILSQDAYPTSSIIDMESFLSSIPQTQSVFEYLGEKDKIYKTTQWWVLCRKDVSTILTKYREFIKTRILNPSVVSGVYAYDEVFFLTLLKWHNPSYTFINFQCMYSWWLINTVTKHPITFNRITKYDVQKIRKSGAFFMRKTLSTFKPTPHKLHKELVILYIGTETNQNECEIPEKYDLIIISAIDIKFILEKLLNRCMYVINIIYRFYKESLKNLIDDIGEDRWEKIICTSEKFVELKKG
jgi:hypothetical protein